MLLSIGVFVTIEYVAGHFRASFVCVNKTQHISFGNTAMIVTIN